MGPDGPTLHEVDESAVYIIKRSLEPWIFVTADDLTGALEVGAKFAARGLCARVTCDTGTAEALTPVFVVDTETRHRPATGAASVVRSVAERMRLHAPRLVYQKTDSTLRGNIAAELQALSEVFPDREVLYVPAYPAMGRTVQNGCLLVHGVPVHRTAFANDPLNPIRDSNISAVLRGVPARIIDGETDEDIRAAARRIAYSGQPLIVAGPAAIAGALAECLPWHRASTPALPAVKRCLVINGSMNPASARQIEFASRQGCFTDHWSLFEYRGDHAGMDRAMHVGQHVKLWLSRNAADAIIVFGGDTAFGIHQALDAPAFESYGEVLPGVPVSRSGDLVWITKAGGFGEAGMLCDIRNLLT